MMTIKFRGKRLDNREWVVGSLLQDDYGTCMIVEFADHHEQWHEVAPKTVVQYTGLNDKNGKEIYEDDILVDESGAYAVVNYSMGCFCVDFGEGFDLQYFTDGIHEICYVVGNVHDNPELLKGGER